MLAVFINADTDAARKKSAALLKEWQKKSGEAEVIKIDDRITLAELEELAASARLFAPALIVEGNFVFESPEVRERAEAMAAKLAASSHHFVLVERDAPAELAKSLKKHAEIFDQFKAPFQKPSSDFSFADAFGARDRRALWTRYQARLRAAASAEELHGQLFWQVKTMLAVAGGTDAGVHPFVAQKAKQFLKKYSPAELQQVSLDLALVYHDGHQSGEGLETSFERWILAFK